MAQKKHKHTDIMLIITAAKNSFYAISTNFAEKKGTKRYNLAWVPSLDLSTHSDQSSLGARWQSTTLILWMNIDQKELEIELLIAICRTGNKWQTKTLFQAIFDQCWSIVKSVF